MAVNQIPISVAVRKNTNTKSPAYGKYYPVVLNDKTITTRALLEHIMSHGLGIPRSIVQAVLIQISECLTELLLQGQPVKLDGFGTFKLSAHVTDDGGWTYAQLKEAGFNVRDRIKGLKLVVIPDNTELDKLTSTANLAKASLTMEGVIVKDATGEETSTAAVQPLPAYIYATDNPGGNG